MAIVHGHALMQALKVMQLGLTLCEDFDPQLQEPSMRKYYVLPYP